MHRYQIRVRYGDTDQMGVAYYANYLRWFEVGRAELMRDLGWTYREIEASGIRLPVVEAACRYLAPARYDEPLWLETAVTRLARVSVHFAYRVRRAADGALLAEGRTEHAFMDDQGRVVRAPQRLALLLERAREPRA